MIFSLRSLTNERDFVFLPTINANVSSGVSRLTLGNNKRRALFSSGGGGQLFLHCKYDFRAYPCLCVYIKRNTPQQHQHPRVYNASQMRDYRGPRAKIIRRRKENNNQKYAAGWWAAYKRVWTSTAGKTSRDRSRCEAEILRDDLMGNAGRKRT